MVVFLPTAPVAETPRLRLRCVEGRDAPAIAEMMTEAISKRLASWPVPYTPVMAADRIAACSFMVATGDGPVDAAFQCVKMLFPHQARLQVYQVAAVTAGTDAQATVSVRLEEDGRIVTGSSADTDTIVASVKAYVNALNKLIVRRTKSAPDSDVKSVNYKDVT